MKALRLALPVVLALLAGACNLVKLSDDIAQAQCEGDDDCEVLNERDDPAFDPCHVWQCAASRYCEAGPLDGDGDGFSPGTVMHDGEPRMCVEEVSERDCDDSDLENAPGLEEACDGRDNDCDTFVDEGALGSEAKTLVALADGAPVAASYALDLTSGTVAVGFAWERAAGTVPAFSVVGEGLTQSAAPSVLGSEALPALRVGRVAVSALDAGRFAVALPHQGAARRLVAGVVEAQAPSVLALDPGLAASGLACAADEPCIDGVTASGESGGIGLAAVGEHVLVAHARAAESDPVCDELVGSDAAPLVLSNLLLAPRNDPALVERTTEALVLGRTSAPESDPVVLSLAPVGDEGASLGWLVGYVDGDGGVVFDRVAREGDALAVAQAAVVAIEGAEGPAFEPAAWLSFIEGGDTRLGVAYRRGCPDDSRVVAQIFSLAVDAGAGALTATALGTAVEVGGTRSESGPAIAYNAARASWIVSWRDSGGLRARVLDASGGPRGDEAYTPITQGGGVGVLLATGAVPLTGAWFGVLAAVSRADGAFAFEAARLNCGL